MKPARLCLSRASYSPASDSSEWRTSSSVIMAAIRRQRAAFSSSVRYSSISMVTAVTQRPPDEQEPASPTLVPKAGKPRETLNFRQPIPLIRR
jgi:hypothetical protein